MAITSSSDSLNELSLGLNESADDNEKLLANILEECQMEDAKALNQTSNFWNGILEEDNNTLPVNLELDDAGRASTPKFDKSIGYCSDVISFYSRSGTDEIAGTSNSNIKERKLKSPPLCQSDVTRSHFKIMRTKTDQLLHIKLKSNPFKVEVPLNDSSVPVKIEPQDDEPTEIIPTETNTIKIEQISSADATASHDYAASPSNEPRQVTVLKPVVRTGTIQTQQIFTTHQAAMGAHGIRRQINGPQGE